MCSTIPGLPLMPTAKFFDFISPVVTFRKLTGMKAKPHLIKHNYREALNLLPKNLFLRSSRRRLPITGREMIFS